MSISDGDNPRGVLDQDIIEELREDMEDEFFELIEAFLDETPTWLASLDAAVRNTDAEQIFQAAHTLKSSSGYMGATVMQSLAAKLESCGRDGGVHDCEPSLQELHQEYEALRPRLETLVKS
jgi:HPt (histidine-containing phosphotransfer) domain-containing protein